MNSDAPAEPSQTRLNAFVLGSVILHSLILAGWQTSPRMSGQAASVLSVILEPSHIQVAPAGTRPSAQTSHRAGHHAADEQTIGPSGTGGTHVPPLATETTPVEIASPQTGDSHRWDDRLAPTKENSQDDSEVAQIPTTSSVLTTGEETAHDPAMAQIRARLNTDLARYFDYPYVARLRGWEGRVMLVFNIETSGRLENIRVAQSSGFAILDDSALNSLRQVERLTEATTWLRGGKLAMQIPIVYRLH
jgi:TonB family protein